MTIGSLARCCCLLPVWLVNAAPAAHLQVGGEWCFIQAPERVGNQRAVILIHGNGETVGPETSSWEQNAGTRLLMDRLVAEGYLVAQSNAAATPANGMWGNEATQRAVVALMEYLRTERGVRAFDAIGLSAGNLTLLNLALGGKAHFLHAILGAPVISLVSLYRCPGGFERVKGISAAYGFAPAGGCPGDPAQDEGFVRGTQGFDALRTIESDVGAVERLAGTKWMACYEERDPKVPPPENILALKKRMVEGKAAMTTVVVPGAASHTSREMFELCTPAAIRFLRGQ